MTLTTKPLGAPFFAFERLDRQADFVPALGRITGSRRPERWWAERLPHERLAGTAAAMG